MSYLTLQEYLDRAGEAETTRLTDETRTGTYDSEKLETALSDSEEEVDGYLAGRYAIPLSSPPRLVKGFVYALTRERLHKTQVPQAVKDEAERARSQLRDLARGVMKLPSETGPVAETARPAADSASSGDGTAPVFTEERLAGFSVPTGSSVSRWRV